MVWLEVRILPASLMNSPQFAGISAGSNAGRAVSVAAEVAIASILAAGLWALQTRSWRRRELHMKTAKIKSTNRASRIVGTTRQEHRGGEDADAARQSSFDGGHKVGREERERDRHIDLSSAAVNNI